MEHAKSNFETKMEILNEITATIFQISKKSLGDLITYAWYYTNISDLLFKMLTKMSIIELIECIPNSQAAAIKLLFQNRDLAWKTISNKRHNVGNVRPKPCYTFGRS